MKLVAPPHTSLVILALSYLAVDSLGQENQQHVDNTYEEAKNLVIEENEPFKRWTVVPSFGWTFFSDGRDSWQRETVDIYYQPDKYLLLGTSVDFFQRPPSGSDVRYSFNTSWYPRKDLEVHGEVSIVPDADFLADERYLAGFQYTVNSDFTLLFDIERLHFDANSARPDFEITQIKPGVSYWFSEKSFLTLRYTHGWLHDEADYDYYSATVNFGDLPHDSSIVLGVGYGSDPDLELGSRAATLSNAYIGSIYYKRPLRPDLSIYAGVDYVYRMRADSNAELYQSFTPTIGLSWKF